MRTAYILKPEVRPTASYSQGSEERTEIHLELKYGTLSKHNG
jgi:hypothetical protein